MERSDRDDVTDGPGNVTVDEPTETALSPEDEDLQEPAGSGDDASSDDSSNGASEEPA